MSAKPKMDDNRQDGANAHSADIPARYAGQDVFVPEDPALQGERSRSNARQAPVDDPMNAASALKPVFNSDLKVEKLTYIHQMLGELRKLSLALDEPMVSYLLEMALLEADTALNVGQFRRDMSSNGKVPIL